MKIVIIHGQSHKGSTYLVTSKLIHKIKQKSKDDCQIKEFYLPTDFNQPCLGCFTCFNTDLTHCPHFKQLQPLSDAILASDLIVLDSPVYVYHASGQMMNFLDHFGTWWIVHRPRVEMTTKQAIIICTAAGGGMKSTIKDMKDSLEMWGVSKIYSLSFAVQTGTPNEIPEFIKKNIEKKTDSLSNKIGACSIKEKMNFRAKRWFYIIRLMHKSFQQSDTNRDDVYWKNQGWINKKRPWK